MTKKSILMCSFGKDSLASLIVAYENKIPINEIIYCETMFDNKRNISGENIEHINWIYKTAIPIIEKLGYKVTVLKSTKDYITIFNQTIKRSKHTERIGKIKAFPIANKCIILKECKLNPINKYLKNNTESTIYLGIAADEQKRLKRLKNNKTSLLKLYNIKENETFEICKKYNLLSPIYNTKTRNGCWFCPNQKIKSFCELYNNNKELWNELEELNKKHNKVSKLFRYKQTLEDVKKLIIFNNRQTKINFYENEF